MSDRSLRVRERDYLNDPSQLARLIHERRRAGRLTDLRLIVSSAFLPEALAVVTEAGLEELMFSRSRPFGEMPGLIVPILTQPIKIDLDLIGTLRGWLITDNSGTDDGTIYRIEQTGSGTGWYGGPLEDPDDRFRLEEGSFNFEDLERLATTIQGTIYDPRVELEKISEAGHPDILLAQRCLGPARLREIRHERAQMFGQLNRAGGRGMNLAEDIDRQHHINSLPVNQFWQLRVDAFQGDMPSCLVLAFLREFWRRLDYMTRRPVRRWDRDYAPLAAWGALSEYRRCLFSGPDPYSFESGWHPPEITDGTPALLQMTPDQASAIQLERERLLGLVILGLADPLTPEPCVPF